MEAALGGSPGFPLKPGEALRLLLSASVLSSNGFPEGEPSLLLLRAELHIDRLLRKLE